MSDPKDSVSGAVNDSGNSTMDNSDKGGVRDVDSLGDMINSAAMSILDGEDFTMGPAPVK